MPLQFGVLVSPSESTAHSQAPRIQTSKFSVSCITYTSCKLVDVRGGNEENRQPNTKDFCYEMTVWLIIRPLSTNLKGGIVPIIAVVKWEFFAISPSCLSLFPILSICVSSQLCHHLANMASWFHLLHFICYVTYIAKSVFHHGK